MMQSNAYSKSTVRSFIILSCFLSSTFWSPGTKAQTFKPTNNSIVIDRELSGSEGWYLFGSPFVSSTLSNLTDSLLTQGIMGSYDPTQISNILLWNEALLTWEIPDSMTTTLEAAEAFAIYVFEDDDPGMEGIQGGFPKRLTSSGDLNPLPINIPLSYIEGSSNALNGFNLLSNPTTSILDWEKINKGNASSSFYSWDPVNSNYKVYQEDGISVNGAEKYMYPFQGFWVKTEGTGASIDIDSTAISLDTESKSISNRSIDFASVLLQITNEDDFSDELRLVTRENASTSFDSLDAVKLFPLSFQNININSYSTDSVALTIDTRPLEEEMIFDLNIEANSTSKELTLSLVENGLSDEWFVQLINTEISERYDLKESNVELTAGDYNWQIRITVLTTSTTKPDYGFPTILTLQQNYPNPFNPTTSIGYQLPEAANIELSVFNLLGKRVAVLVNEQKPAGYHEVTFDARNLSSGIYIYQLKVKNTVLTKRLTLIK